MILNDRNNWFKTLTYFTNLYAMRKAYSEDRAVERGFEISANVTHIYSPAIIINSSFNMNIGGTMGSITPTQYGEVTATYNDYIEGVEESLADAK